MVKDLRLERCSYCNTELDDNERTEDHIPPSSFFTTNEREKFNPIKILSCKKCNTGFSCRDENAKHFLSLCAMQMGRDTADQRKNHRKTLVKNDRLMSHVKNATVTLLLDSEKGRCVTMRKLSIEKLYQDDTYSVMLRVGCGLYWVHHKIILERKNFAVKCLAGISLERLERLGHIKLNDSINAMKTLMSACTRVDLLPEVFTYWISNSDSLPAMCFMLYRNAVLFYMYEI